MLIIPDYFIVMCLGKWEVGEIRTPPGHYAVYRGTWPLYIV